MNCDSCEQLSCKACGMGLLLNYDYFPPETTQLYRTAAGWEPADYRTQMRTGAMYNYVVQSGDSLSSIAIAKYGDWQLFPDIWAINHTTRGGPLGDNPNVIAAGVTLRLADTATELMAESGLTEGERASLIDQTGTMPLPSELSPAELTEATNVVLPAETTGMSTRNKVIAGVAAVSLLGGAFWWWKKRAA